MATLNTAPIYIYTVSISGVNGLAGSANYTGGTAGNNLSVYGCPAGLTKGDTYEVAGYKLGTTQHVTFPAATFNGYLAGTAGVGEFTATGWENL